MDRRAGKVSITATAGFFYNNSRMSGKSIYSEDKKINKSNFYKDKKLFNIFDLDVNKMLVSKKESYGTKN